MKEILQQLLCVKLDIEMAVFKRNILQLDKEKIYEKAYEIDSMINLYELLSDRSQEVEEETLKKMLLFPNLLTFFNTRWLKAEGSIMEDYRACIKDGMQEISRIYNKAELEVRTE